MRFILLGNESDITKVTARFLFPLIIIALLLSAFSQNALAMLLLAFGGIWGIFNIVILLKKGGKLLPGLVYAILSVAISLALLGYGMMSYRNNALEVAIEKGNTQKVKELISKGYDVNAKSTGGQNMLTLCFRYGLKKINPFRDTRQISRKTPEEVEDKIYAMLEILIDNGANINTLDPHGWAPIHDAARRNQTRIVKMLIEKGADVNLKSKSGDSPLHMATEPPHSSEMIKMLIENGAKVDAKDARGDTPLHNSIYSGGDLESVETLLEKGADVNAKNNESKTPLMLAMESNREEIVELLHKHEAEK